MGGPPLHCKSTVSGGCEVRILWVKANKLLPVHSGGDIRSYNIAHGLAAQHDLTFLSYYDGTRDQEYEKELKHHFPGSVCFCTEKPTTSLPTRVLDYMARFSSEAPYAVSRFASQRVREKLRGWFQEQSFDVVVCDFLDAAVNFPRKITIPTVLFQHNVESEIWRRLALVQPYPARKFLYKVEFAKMVRYERKMVRRFQHVIAVSEHDRKLMSRWVDPARITVVPTGVDLKQFKGNSSGMQMENLVIFVGAMDWGPNVDAVQYFCEEIWPEVRAKIPGARFRIVGRNPDRRVQKLAGESIDITGSVPSVVEHLDAAAVVVVPLRIGGGTRLKIYEAMAASKAVVSTSVGAEGLDVHHGSDIVLADDPTTFAENVVNLLRDEKLRRRYEQSAAALAAKYDWAAITEEFLSVLRSLASAVPMMHRQYVSAPEV
jgi:glycosyltransferase involved in cell wall biosynthesis